MRKVDRTENGAVCFTFFNLKFIKVMVFSTKETQNTGMITCAAFGLQLFKICF